MSAAPNSASRGVDAVVAHDPLGGEPEADGRQRGGDDEAAVQRLHDAGVAFLRLDDEGADDRCDDGNAAQHQRIDDGGGAGARQEQAAEKHGGHHGDRIGFEEVGGHACAVADVVADVVGDDGGVAWVVFRNAGFDLADDVGADVGALGEDAAAESREDGDQRAAEGQAHEGMQGVGTPMATRTA